MTVSSCDAHPINFLAATPPPQISMSFEMQPSPVTGFRLRRNEDENIRDTERAEWGCCCDDGDWCGLRDDDDVEDDEWDDVDVDMEDMGDN